MSVVIWNFAFRGWAGEGKGIGFALSSASSSLSFLGGGGLIKKVGGVCEGREGGEEKQTRRGFRRRVRGLEQCLQAIGLVLEKIGMPQLVSGQNHARRVKGPLVVPFVAEKHVAEVEGCDVQSEDDDAEVAGEYFFIGLNMIS